jgi:hypothetical protein
MFCARSGGDFVATDRRRFAFDFLESFLVVEAINKLNKMEIDRAARFNDLSERF